MNLIPPCPEVEWVWMDLDDTLWDFQANSRALLTALYHERGFDRYFPTALHWLRAYEEHNHALWADYALGRIERSFLLADRFRYPLQQAGHPQADAESRFLDGHYLDRLGSMPLLVPGARELLQSLRARGYKIGVLSNGFTCVQHRKLSTTGLAPLVDLTVLSDDIGVTKPQRGIFDHAVALAATRPDRCLMVGDNPATDIAGAVAAGWRAIYFHRPGPGTELPPLPAGVPAVTSLEALNRTLS